MGKRKGKKSPALATVVEQDSGANVAIKNGSSVKVEDGLKTCPSEVQSPGRTTLGSRVQGESNSVIPGGSSVDSAKDSLAINDGFQPVLSPAERRQIRRQNSSVTNSEVTVDRNDEKSGANYYNSMQNKFRARLNNIGINVAQLPITSEMAMACKASISELTDMIGDLDFIIKSAASNAKKPLQFKTVEEVDTRIREVNEHLKRLKVSRGKPNGPTPEEYEHANKENEIYVSYLRDQRVVVDGYQRMKNFQATMTQYKKACIEVMELKASAEKYQSSMENKSKSQSEYGSSRKNEYVCDLLRSLKTARGLPFDPSLLTRSEIVIMATPHRFQAPYNYLRRIKERFCVHTEKIDAIGSEVSAVRIILHGEDKDVNDCAEFLRSLDFHAARKIQVDFDCIKKIFGGIFGLSSLEDSFNVLTFYYQGLLDVIGTRDGVNLALSFVNSKVSELGKPSENAQPPAVSSSIPSNMAEFEALKMKLQYDYLICKALTTRFRHLVRNVELECGVSVTLNMSPAEGKGTLSINVDTSNITNEVPAEERIKKAATMLSGSISDLVYREVPGNFDEETMSFLFSEAILRSRFVSQEFCLLRYNGSPYVVGNKEILKYGVERVNSLVRCMHMKAREHFVPMEKTVLLSDSTLSGIEDWTGVTIMMRDSINGVVLAISGEAEQQEECVKQINDILKTYIEYTLDLSPAHFAVLSDNKYRIIKELEQKSQVKVVTKKESNQLVFHGQKEKVEDAVSVIKAFTENFVCLDTTKIDDVTMEGYFYAWIRVPRRHIPAVIGKSGSTIREIINESGLRNMFVNRGDNPDEIVCFEGKKESIKRALQVLSHILEFDGVYQKAEPEEDSYVGKYSSAYSILRRNAPKQPQRSTAAPKGAGKPIVFDCRDEAAFPGLRR